MDVLGKLVSIETTMMKLQKNDQTGKWSEIEARGQNGESMKKFVFKFLMQDGTINRINQQGSEKALAFAREKIFPTHGLSAVLQLMPLLGAKIPIWLKPSDNPQYKDSWQFAQNAAAPQAPQQQAPQGGYQPPPQGPAPGYEPQQDVLPNMPPPPTQTY